MLHRGTSIDQWLNDLISCGITVPAHYRNGERVSLACPHPYCGPLWNGNGTPVSSSVLRPLRISFQPPPAPSDSRPPVISAATFGAPVTSCVTVSLVTPPLAASISYV